MNFFVTKKMLVAVILLLCGILIAIWLTGCGHSTAGLRPPGTGTPGVHGGPAGALAGLAVWATWAAGVGLLLCGVAAIYLPNKLAVGKVAACCLAAIAVSFLLGWVADHKTLVVGASAAVLLLAAIAYIWLHRVDVKKRTGIDLNWLCRVKKLKP